MLYSREFFEIVKKRLNPGGVVTLFVQLYESNTEAVKSEVATFLEAFPNGMVFGNTNNGQGYDMVLFGQVEPTEINLDEIQAKLDRPEYRADRAVAARDRNEVASWICSRRSPATGRSCSRGSRTPPSIVTAT